MNSLKKKRVLVTGGAGFVGSNLVRALVNRYDAVVTVLDNLFTGTPDNLQGVDCQFVLGSVEDEAVVDSCVGEADVVFHLASRNIIVSNRNPREDLNANVKGSFNVFEAAARQGGKQVVYTSTSSIYGQPKQLPIREDDPKSYLNFYSASKFSAEVYAHTFHEVFGLPVTILRYSNVYGPNQLPANPYCGVIGKLIRSALANQPLKVHGTGAQTRDYTYVDDAVQATINAALFPAAVGQDFNLGTGIEVSVNELAQRVIQLTGSDSTVEYIENRDIDNIHRRCIDISKARMDLNYEPVYNIAEGLRKTIQWFLQHPELAIPGVRLQRGLTTF